MLINIRLGDEGVAMQVRRAVMEDMQRVLMLYTALHGEDVPPPSDALDRLWQCIIQDENRHILLGEEAGEAVAACEVVLVPNLTHSQRPYALVENVVTAPGHRRRGYALKVLLCARELAQSQNCYKLMLLTSGKTPGSYDLYEKAGFNKNDKTAFVMWL